MHGGHFSLAARLGSLREGGHFSHRCTAYRATERFPGGDFVNQRESTRPDGLAVWTARDDNLDGADVVLWHVFAATHLVRTEDAPVMPCERVGFALKPHGFFDISPCVDVPCEACEAAAVRRSKL